MSDALIDFLLLRQVGTRSVVFGAILLGIASATIGCFALLRKRALVGDAVAHALLPGVAIAFMIVQTKNPLPLMIGGMVTGWIAMIVMDSIVRNSRIREDAAIGMTLSVFFGLGILLLTHIQHGGHPEQSGLDRFLFGQAASIVGADVILFAVVTVLMIATVVVAFKEFALISFDPEFARGIGFPVKWLEILMTTLLVLAVVIGIQAVGVVLMAALLITPAAAARFWTDRLGVMIVIACTIGILSGYGGAFISYVQPRMPTGPWIVVVASVLFFLSILLAPGRGVVARLLRRRATKSSTVDENILKTFHRVDEIEEDEGEGRSIDDLLAVRQMARGSLERGIRRLAAHRYIEPTGDGRWRLTAEGRARGARITRLHRLWEVYLTEYVRIAPDHVHDDAETIEHVLTPELEEELERILERPASDPHSRVIPYRS